MKPQKYFFKLLDILTVLCLLIFFASFGFKDSKSGGWYQQWFPNMNGSTIQSITFLDSLTGYAVTNSNSLLQEYILKTTNGGDNWIINFTYNTPNLNWSFIKISFINSNTGFAFSWAEMFKTTNGGNNWSMITNDLYPQDIAVINKDTMLAVKNSGLDGGVYRTTNGGLNWQALGQVGGSGQPNRIYMFNKDIGFCQGGQMRKTTNGGVNWFAITGESYSSIQFVDSLTGWKCYDSIKKTTNGGINWFAQRTPNISHNFTYYTCFSLLNKDTLWMGGAYLNYKGILYKTTNGGTNWGYQIPDSTLTVYSYGFISFVNKNVGWANPASPTSEIHTVIGGNDTTFYTGINNNITTILKNYILYQNYPNPFNQCTVINVQLQITKHVKINIYDITGKLINTIINQKENSGLHSYKFDGGNLSTGVYFYTLFVDGNRVDTKKAILIK
jgi:photosystem II stability/assembly factor-like uncharacterized protein